MAILVLAEHDHTLLKSATLHTVTAAQKLGSDVHVVVAGHNAAPAAEAASKLAGVTKVLHVDTEYLTQPTAENVTAQLVEDREQFLHDGRRQAFERFVEQQEPDIAG